MNIKIRKYSAFLSKRKMSVFSIDDVWGCVFAAAQIRDADVKNKMARSRGYSDAEAKTG